MKYRLDIKKLTDRHAIILLLIAGLFHSLYNITLDLHPDEVYYWFWGKKLQLSYYDHPPMVAYLIGIFTLFSDHEFFVRLPAVFSMSITGWFIYKLAKDIYDSDIAWIALFTYLIIPAISIGYTIVTPDAPLMLFWSLSMFTAYRALFNGGWRNYLFTGLAIGGLMLSKYMSVLFLASLLLFILIKMPRKLLEIKPWAAIVLAFAIFLPVIYWNYQNDWISFSFQYSHGSGESAGLRPDKFLEFFGGLFAVFTPVFFAVLLYGTFRYKSYFFNDKKFFIAITYLFPLTFFLYKALFKKMEMNWVAVAFFSGTILFAATVKELNLKKSYIAGSLLAVLLSLILHFPSIFFLPPKLNIHYRLNGDKESAIKAKEHLKPGDILMADHPRRAAMFSYYADGARQAHLPIKARFSQYTIWDENFDFNKVQGVFLSKSPRKKELLKQFKHVRLLEEIEIENKGFKTKKFYIYRCSNLDKTEGHR
ncbi:MAG: glycosyltransferase family 39 protein [bacterium]|nr:glycosyltransferase family 39 protein [bacterium]